MKETAKAKVGKKAAPESARTGKIKNDKSGEKKKKSSSGKKSGTKSEDKKRPKVPPKDKAATRASSTKPSPRKKSGTSATKTSAKKTPAKKAPAKKTPAKKTPAKKTPAKKTPAKTTGKSAADKKYPPTKTSTKTSSKNAPTKTVSKTPTVSRTAGKSGTKKVGATVTKATPSVVAKKTARPGKSASRSPGTGGGHRAPTSKVPFASYKGTRPYIFVSYSHKDMTAVFGIIKKLSESRYRLWYDEGIEPGFEWPEVVGKALMGCSQLLVFMSRTAAVSRNVRNEINLAFSEGKSILVVYLEKTKLTEGMQLQIGTVQFINRHEMGSKEFVEKLKSVLNNDLHN